MEYKYHPIYKYGSFFIIMYLFLRYQKLMANDILLLNTLLITVFVMIVDQMFIHNHITIVQPLSDQYFDSKETKDIEKEIEKEIKKDEKLKEKMKKKEKGKVDIADEDIYSDELHNESRYDNRADDYNRQQEIYDDVPYNYDYNYDAYQPLKKPLRMQPKDNMRHYAYSEPIIDAMDDLESMSNIMPFNA